MRWYLVVLTALTLLLAAALPIMANSVHEATADQSAAQLEEAIWAYEDALQAGEAGQLAALFAEDAYSLPPGLSPVVGKPVIERYFEGMFGEYVLTREFELVDVQVSGEYATRLGQWTNTFMPVAGGPPIVEVGRCMFGYEFDGEAWKISWQIWNDYDEPAPAMSHDGTPC